MNALIMAGGCGSRFWPLSRKSRPKQFISIMGEETLLGKSLSRIKPLAKSNIFIVAGKSHFEQMRNHAPQVPPENLILEPASRNTAAAIGLASVFLKQKGKGEEVVVVCPADHLIGDEKAFRNTLQKGSKAAAGGKLVVIGVKPSDPSPHYGYIEAGNPSLSFPGLFSVRRFVEKPSRERAAQMLEAGGYYWNAGIFMWTPKSILASISRYMPVLFEGLMKIEKAFPAGKADKVIAQVYKQLPSVPIDIGVLERTQNLVMVPGDMKWSDVGNWSSLMSALTPDADGNVRRGNTLALKSKRSLVWSSGRLVAVVGLEGVAVVETPDAVLVCSLERDHELKELTTLLEQEGYAKHR